MLDLACRWRRGHTTNRRAVTRVRVRTEHEIGQAGCAEPSRACFRQVASRQARMEFVPMTVMGLPLSPGAGAKLVAPPVAWIRVGRCRSFSEIAFLSRYLLQPSTGSLLSGVHHSSHNTRVFDVITAKAVSGVLR